MSSRWKATTTILGICAGAISGVVLAPHFVPFPRFFSMGEMLRYDDNLGLFVLACMLAGGASGWMITRLSSRGTSKPDVALTREDT